jgi:hypothetical protein
VPQHAAAQHNTLQRGGTEADPIGRADRLRGRRVAAVPSRTDLGSYGAVVGGAVVGGAVVGGAGVGGAGVGGAAVGAENVPATGGGPPSCNVPV